MRPLPIREKGGVLVVEIGDGPALNEGHPTGVRQALYAEVESRKAPLVAIDLTGVTYISSTGITLLIGTKRRVDTAEGRLVLFGLHPDIIDLFTSMKLTSLFEIAIDEADALAQLSPPPAS